MASRSRDDGVDRLDLVRRIRALYGESGAAARESPSFRCGAANGSPMSGRDELCAHLARLRRITTGGVLEPVRFLFEFETPIAPETFGVIVGAWWRFRPNVATAEIGTVLGTSLLTFVGAQLVHLDEIWSRPLDRPWTGPALMPLP